VAVLLPDQSLRGFVRDLLDLMTEKQAYPWEQGYRAQRAVQLVSLFCVPLLFLFYLFEGKKVGCRKSFLRTPREIGGSPCRPLSAEPHVLALDIRYLLGILL
jgi:hypothetical protein